MFFLLGWFLNLGILYVCMFRFCKSKIDLWYSHIDANFSLVIINCSLYIWTFCYLLLFYCAQLVSFIFCCAISTNFDCNFASDQNMSYSDKEGWMKTWSRRSPHGRSQVSNFNLCFLKYYLICVFVKKILNNVSQIKSLDISFS